MAEVISGEKLHKHNIDKYNFKILAIGSTKRNPPVFKKESPNIQEENSATTIAPSQPTPNQQEATTTKSSKDELIESLLKKTDEMSSNFIKLQMKLESMQEEHKAELEKIKQEALEEGILKGKEIAQKECEEKYQESLNLFGNSISKLETNANEYNNALEKLKNDLTQAAIDIAQEVVEVELTQHSQEIASKLATSLIEELQNASLITLKVSPKDYTALLDRFANLKHIKVVADNAVSPGGVIAISDIENIDAQIPKRFEKVKKVILSE